MVRRIGQHRIAEIGIGALEILGLLLIPAGVWLIYVPAALIVAGFLALFVAWMVQQAPPAAPIDEREAG